MNITIIIFLVPFMMSSVHCAQPAQQKAVKEVAGQGTLALAQSGANKLAHENSSAAVESIAAQIAKLRIDLAAAPVVPAPKTPRLHSAAAGVPLALAVTPPPMQSPPKLNDETHSISCQCDDCVGVISPITPKFPPLSDTVWSNPESDRDSDSGEEPFKSLSPDQTVKK
jgi:hypothetical protein